MKPHRFEFLPDKYIAGVAGQLTAEEQGVYWLVCSLIMAHGGAIDDDPVRLAGLCRSSKRRIESVLVSLANAGKIERVSGKIRQKTAEEYAEKAQNLMQTARENGQKGGRPSNKNNEVTKPTGFENQKANNSNNNSNNKKNNTGACAPDPLPEKFSDDGFEDFYRAFPVHKGRGAAKRAYRAALRKPGVTPETLLAGAKRYAADPGRKPEFSKHPASWLNGEHWADEGQAVPGEVPQTPERIAAMIASLERSKARATTSSEAHRLNRLIDDLRAKLPERAGAA